MTRENILSIIKGEEVDVTTLNKNNSYIITVELGDTPKETVRQLAERLSNLLRNAQLSHFIIVPTSNGLPALKFYEFKDDQVLEINEDKSN